MAVNYNKLWKILIDKGMSKTEMRIKVGISTNVLARMGRNETVSLDTLCKIANILHCGIDDILDFTTTGDKYDD